MNEIRRPLIVGNWKMNGLSADALPLAADLANRLSNTESPSFDMMICPPFPYLDAIAITLKKSGLQLGAQDCHQDEKGAHTGDVSAPMLRDIGCTFVLVGHSERRAGHKETNDLVKAKANAALSAGLSVVICVGETEKERVSGKTNEVVAEQIAGSLPKLSSAANTVVAYEPVWAIGTGKTPSTDQVQEIHSIIRRQIAGSLAESEADAMRLLYGGSVQPSNSKELLVLKDVDGVLVGGASLNSQDFWAIAESSCLPL